VYAVSFYREGMLEVYAMRSYFAFLVCIPSVCAPSVKPHSWTSDTVFPDLYFLNSVC